LLNPVAIITALKKESNAILSHLSDVEACTGSRLHLFKGRFNGLEVYLAVSGIGRKKAASAADALIAFCRPELLVSCGWAGALDPGLRLSDLVIVKDVFGPADKNGPDAAFKRRGETDPVLRKGLCDRFEKKGQPFSTAAVVTVDRPATTGEERSALRALTGAAIVDMETSALMRCAEKQGVPFLGLRAVSDTTGMTLDGRLLRYHERKQRGRFILRALTRPAAAARLLQFRYGMRRASDTLENGSAYLLHHLTAFHPPL
jgi:adenosylhomocysteine nucleosidase